MLPVGKRDFALLMKPPDAEPKPDVKLLAYHLLCLMVDVVYTVARVLVLKQKRVWSVAGKQTGNMDDVPLKLYEKEKNQWL